MCQDVICIFWHYLIEVFPAVVIGFLISGIIYEFISENWVKKYLGHSGILPILGATIIGVILPVCCFGCLPIAISFHKKGARIGPLLAFLIATPATSISAILVSLQLLGLEFTLFLCLAVVVIGISAGVLGNIIPVKTTANPAETCPACSAEQVIIKSKKDFSRTIISILKFAFIQMPKDIGLEIIIGLAIAAIVAGIIPIGELIKAYLVGFWAYPFALVFGTLMYICSTASVPLVHAFLAKGMNMGGGMILLIVGPVTSYGTILVIRKHLGLKVLLLYLVVILVGSLILGIAFYHLHNLLAPFLPEWMISKIP